MLPGPCRQLSALPSTKPSSFHIAHWKIPKGFFPMGTWPSEDPYHGPSGWEWKAFHAAHLHTLNLLTQGCKGLKCFTAKCHRWSFLGEYIAWKIHGMELLWGWILKQTSSMYFSSSVKCSNVTAPSSSVSKLCFISNSEVSYGDSKAQESCLEKEWELQISLFIKDNLGDNIMKD